MRPYTRGKISDFPSPRQDNAPWQRIPSPSPLSQVMQTSLTLSSQRRAFVNTDTDHVPPRLITVALAPSPLPSSCHCAWTPLFNLDLVPSCIPALHSSTSPFCLDLPPSIHPLILGLFTFDCRCTTLFRLCARCRASSTLSSSPRGSVTSKTAFAFTCIVPLPLSSIRSTFT